MHTSHTGVRLLIAVALIVLTATPSIAGFVDSALGTLEVKGTRWVEGKQEKVVCRAKEGHEIGTTLGQWNLSFLPGDKCYIFIEGASFEFTGSQARVVKNDKPKLLQVFAGVEGEIAGLSGFLTGQITFRKDGSPKSVKGRFSYVVAGPTQVIFEGKFKAKLEAVP